MAESVTVCIPTFNGAHHLDDCLASVAAQDRPAAEVIIADDGSTDATLDLARSWRKDLPSLRVVSNPSRLGPAGNLNRCIELAEGTWVKPMGQDDLLEHDGLARLTDGRRAGVDVVVGARRYRYEGITADHHAGYEEALANALAGWFTATELAPSEDLCRTLVGFVADGRTHLNFLGEPVAVLLRRSAVISAGGFDTRFRQFWDLDLWLRLAVGAGLAVVPEVVGTFRAHQASTTVANLKGASYHLDHIEPLRLQLGYAFRDIYRPVRVAAQRHRPPLDLAAVAAETAWTAWRVAARLPMPAERSEALTAWRATIRDHPGVRRPLARMALRRSGLLLSDLARGRRRLRHKTPARP